MPESPPGLCRFCLDPPTDWCPACQSPLCVWHSDGHNESFDDDERCVQRGPTYPADDAERWRTSTPEALDREGVPLGRLGMTTNRHGVACSLHRCTTCRSVFTVTPPASIEFGNGCLADTCGSYDLGRDIDTFFEPAMEAGWIGREPTDA